MADWVEYENIRQNYLASTYCEIAMESLYKANSYLERIKKANYAGYEISSKVSMDKSIITVVVFSAMTIESFFNNYAATKLGDTDFYDNFDKLSMISKFQLIARFILKSPIDKSKSYYSFLKSLVKNRDSFVHNKSRSLKLNIDSTDDFETIDCLSENADFLIEEYALNKDEIDNGFREALNALRAIKDIAIFFDNADAECYALKSIFHPCGTIMGNEYEKQYKEYVFSELGLKFTDNYEFYAQ